MKKYYLFATLLLGTCLFNGCSNDENEEIPDDVEEVVPGTNHNILIAYFSEPFCPMVWMLPPQPADM